MSLQISVRYKLTCPHHPRYNPESGGEGAIKGGCVICREIFEAWNEASRMVGRLYDLGVKIAEARK